MNKWNKEYWQILYHYFRCPCGMLELTPHPSGMQAKEFMITSGDIVDIKKHLRIRRPMGYE